MLSATAAVSRFAVSGGEHGLLGRKREEHEGEFAALREREGEEKRVARLQPERAPEREEHGKLQQPSAPPR